MAMKNQETIAFKVSTKDKKMLERRAVDERLTVSAYIRTKLFNNETE